MASVTASPMVSQALHGMPRREFVVRWRNFCQRRRKMDVHTRNLKKSVDLAGEIRQGAQLIAPFQRAACRAPRQHTRRGGPAIRPCNQRIGITGGAGVGLQVGG